VQIPIGLDDTSKKDKSREYGIRYRQTEAYKQKSREREKTRPKRDRSAYDKKRNLERKKEREIQRERDKLVQPLVEKKVRKYKTRTRKYQSSPSQDIVAYRRERKYGLSPQQYEDLFERQGKCCGICQSKTPRSKRGWNIDHDHKTGKVRGILCNYCNPMLGNANDDIQTLRRAIAYLKKQIPNP
jgi:flagellar biosynthesis GTPase FlhF